MIFDKLFVITSSRLMKSLKNVELSFGGSHANDVQFVTYHGIVTWHVDE